MVDTEVISGSGAFLASRTLTTRDVLLRFCLGAAVNLTACNTDVFSVISGAAVVVLMATAGGDTAVDRRMS
jgi:hypothetical protein